MRLSASISMTVASGLLLKGDCRGPKNCLTPAFPICPDKVPLTEGMRGVGPESRHRLEVHSWLTMWQVNLASAAVLCISS